MDLLADVVQRLDLRSSFYFRAALSTPFAVEVPEERRRIRIHVAGAGRAWIGLPSGEGTWFGKGDLVLVPHGSAHLLASAPVTTGVPLQAALDAEPGDGGGAFRHGGGGEETLLACGHFEFDETLVHPLIESLPPLIHLSAGEGRSYEWLPLLLEAIDREGREGEPGGAEVALRLSEILFIQVLRAVRAQGGADPGALASLEDPQLGRALKAIHEDPAAPWTLGALASIAGVSRSVFADRFRERIGVTPMRYLTHWRMQRAQGLLTREGLSVGEVGQRVGYASEAAFSRAFRASVGEPPGRYRRAGPA